MIRYATYTKVSLAIHFKNSIPLLFQFIFIITKLQSSVYNINNAIWIIFRWLTMIVNNCYAFQYIKIPFPLCY